MQKNLVLVSDPRRMDRNDFMEIAKRIVGQQRNINVIIVSTEETGDTVPQKLWGNPTLTVSFGPLGKFASPRGLVLRNAPIPKFQQYAQFCLAGIDTPRTTVHIPGRRYEVAEWGEFCIVKPTDLARTSAGGTVQWLRTRRMAAFDPKGYPEDHVFRKSGLLVQSFVDTGRFPVNWRVLTLFGRPLYCFRSTCPIERPALDAPDEAIEKAVIEPKHPSVKETFDYAEMRDFAADPEIMAFARRIHRAFPRLPLLGCDILREEGTGKLYAIEINGGGNTWHFSSPTFARQRKLLGGKEVFTRQLDAFGVAAQVLVDRTEQLAI
jgi:hypothetical protein